MERENHTHKETRVWIVFGYNKLHHSHVCNTAFFFLFYYFFSLVIRPAKGIHFTFFFNDEGIELTFPFRLDIVYVCLCFSFTFKRLPFVTPE